MSVNVTLRLGGRNDGRGGHTESAGNTKRLVVGRHGRGAERRGGGKETIAVAACGGAPCLSALRATALISAGRAPFRRGPAIKAPPPSDPMLPPAIIPHIPPPFYRSVPGSLCSSSYMPGYASKSTTTKTARLGSGYPQHPHRHQGVLLLTRLPGNIRPGLMGT